MMSPGQTCPSTPGEATPTGPPGQQPECEPVSVQQVIDQHLWVTGSGWNVLSGLVPAAPVPGAQRLLQLTWSQPRRTCGGVTGEPAADLESATAHLWRSYRGTRSWRGGGQLSLRNSYLRLQRSRRRREGSKEAREQGSGTSREKLLSPLSSTNRTSRLLRAPDTPSARHAAHASSCTHRGGSGRKRAVTSK